MLQALSCRSSYVSLNNVFLEDLGGHPITNPARGPPLSPTQLPFGLFEKLLEGVNDARRLAGYLCHISGADHKRPVSVLSTSHEFGEEFFQGWPNLALSNDSLSVNRCPLGSGIRRARYATGSQVSKVSKEQFMDSRGDDVSEVHGTRWDGAATGCAGKNKGVVK